MDSYINLNFVRKKNLLAHISIWTIVAIALTLSLTVFKENLFGIIYILFFLIFVLVFQSSYSLWARSIKTYCVILILYSTSVSLLTYTYQFESIKSIYKDVFSEQVLNDIGLVEQNSTLNRFLEPSAPIVLALLLFLYLVIFHDDFSRFAYLAEETDGSLSTPLTGSQLGLQASINDSTIIMLSTNNSLNNQDSANQLNTQQIEQHHSRTSIATTINGPSASRNDLRRITKHAAIKNFINQTVECFWRLLETHFLKVVVFMIFRLPIIDVCLLNAPFLIIVIIALRYPTTSKCSCLMASWLITSIVILRNIANLHTVRMYDIIETCPATGPPLLAGKPFGLFTDYVGLNLRSGTEKNSFGQHILVLLLITIFSFICNHYERRTKKDFEASFGVIFTGIGRREADISIINSFKYFCNFGFYKFGIEVTCLILVVAISNRLDVVATIYGLILIFLGVTTSRQALSTIWPLLTFLIGLLIPLQYVLKLGLPKVLCNTIPYPWDGFSADLKIWLFLPGYEKEENNPNEQLLLYDFLVLLAICRQSAVFRLMKSNSSYSILRSDQQLNENALRSKYLPSADEYETEDCFSNYTTHSNFLKSTFFKSIYWVTLSFVLVAGATKISLFSLGYLIGCFIFLWLGNDAYLMNLRRLIYSWNWLIFYATLVIFIKAILQLIACEKFDYLLANCYIMQLLGVICYRKVKDGLSHTCGEGGLKNFDKLDILWDGLCLVFLLMQRIVFNSQYFKYLVQEVKAQQILASHGAELILATQIEEAKTQALYEKEVMRNIREKMENIKSDSEEASQVWQRLLTLPHHHQVIRNADKHLFSRSPDDSVSETRADDWKFKRSFIPDPIGDELERMNQINGISAVFTRWLKGQPLYGQPQSSTPPNAISGDHNEEKLKQIGSIANEGEEGVSEDPYDKISEIDSTESDTKIRDCWDMLNLIVYSILLSATVELNKLSRSYRYVSRRMAFEKSVLKKDHKNDLMDDKLIKDHGWRRRVFNKLSQSYEKTHEQQQEMQSNTSLHRIKSALKVMESNAGITSRASSQDSAHSSDSNNRSPTSGHQMSRAESLNDPEYHFLQLNMFTQFCRALGHVFVSNTSLLCHLVIVFNQIVTLSLLSLPLPLLIFLWGTLSVPRPTKRFWKTVITYTELVIVVKYIFQFPIWSFDSTNSNPYYYRNLLLGFKDITIINDLIVLLTLFLHRSVLKSLGQWDATVSNSDKSEPLSECENKGQQDNLAFGSESSSNEMRFAKSFQAQENLDRSIELASRVIKSEEIGTTGTLVDYGTSYQNSDENEYTDVINQEAETKAAPPSNSWMCRAYRRIRRSIILFFQHALKTPHKVQTDVYVWMFLCDFINFLILIYGFWAFGSGYSNQTVASVLKENRIPLSVLIMLLAQFASIMFDRAFYLQKNIVGKLIFQLVLVVGIHIWLFFALPFATGRVLTGFPKAFYVIKCIYWLLSAHQIRCGYPRRVLGNCFTKGFGYGNLYAFKFYRALPLVYDLRLYMDWIWTETTLEFRNWSIMEDMFANVFIRRCDLTIEEEYPQPRARPISRFSKYLTGGSFIIFILAIIWGPLLLFSMGRTVGESNPPVEMEFELEFVGYQPFLRLRATAQQIYLNNETLYGPLRNHFGNQSFFGDYTVGDVAVIELDGQSNAVWEISPPSKKLLMSDIKNSKTLILKSSWTFTRIKREQSQNIDVNVGGSYQKELDSNLTIDLYKMLEDSSSSKTPENDVKYWITPPIFPNYLKVPETGQVTLVELDDNPLRKLNLTYIRQFDENLQVKDNSTSWWKAVDICKYLPLNDSYPFWSEDTTKIPPTAPPLPHCNSLVVVAFNNRIFTGVLAILTAFGIIGIYTTFVVFFARLIRTEPASRVIYTEISSADRVYGLIMDIYMMRECGEFELEEKLFAKLLYLFRSPEMLIEWSKRGDGQLQSLQ